MKIKNVKKYETGTGEITIEYAEKTFQQLLAFQGYGFCKAHATSYSVYSAIQMWLQDHYFLEYMCVLLSHIDRAKEKKGVSILNERVQYCVKHGTSIYYPDVNESNDKWQIKAGGLLAPLKNIKGFSDREVNNIVNHRPYADLKDFLDKTEFNNKRFETLLFANAFNKWGTVEDLYNWYYNHYFEKGNKKKQEIQTDDLFSYFETNESSASEIKETIQHFTKVELEEKCMDLNGFVIPNNLLMKYHYVYEKHLGDFINNVSEGEKGRNIYPLSELMTAQKTDNSKPMWSLVQVKQVVLNLKTKKSGSKFNKVLVSDGINNLNLFIWGQVIPSYMKKGNVIIIPFKVVTDTETKENNISFCKWATEEYNIPIIYQEE